MGQFELCWGEKQTWGEYVRHGPVWSEARMASDQRYVEGLNIIRSFLF